MDLQRASRHDRMLGSEGVHSPHVSANSGSQGSLTFARTIGSIGATIRPDIYAVEDIELDEEEDVTEETQPFPDALGHPLTRLRGGDMAISDDSSLSVVRVGGHAD